MAQHAAEKFWWGDVASTTNMAFKTREQALWAEWGVISTCHPLYNAKVSPPADHRCPEAISVPAPTAIDGHIGLAEKLAWIRANADAYAKLNRRVDEAFAQAGVDAVPHPRFPTDGPLIPVNQFSIEELHEASH